MANLKGHICEFEKIVLENSPIFVKREHCEEILHFLKELEKHKIAIKYFEDHGYRDIVKNLLSY